MCRKPERILPIRDWSVVVGLEAATSTVATWLLAMNINVNI